MEKIKLIAVVGPTASGKTSLAVDISQKYSGEVVSCDSMQIYKYMSIATAKPTKEEMCSVPHYMIDFLDPKEKFSVAEFSRLAGDEIADISTRGKLPVLCGGTGLYVSSLIDNISFSPAGSDYKYREELRERAEKYGAQNLLDELATYDSESAEKLHPNNLSRIIRAMEHYKVSGVTISEQNRLSRLNPSPYDALMIGINFRNRQALYDRIDLRVDKMLENGLEEEAKWYFSQTDFGTASAAIGYKELKPYFDGECSLSQAVEDLKRETRRFAKRQLTWFRRDERIHWIYADEAENGTLFEQSQKIIKDEDFLK